MIFSRMSEALRDQNWFVVAIEILVLVVGIFIGLQVDEWNQQRQDKDDEQHFLKRLHADIETAEYLSSRVRDRRLARNQVLTDAADVIFGRLDQEQLTPEQCIAVHSSSFFNINVTSLPSAEELMGTGRLGIIRNSELRTALVELKQTRETLQFLILIQVTAVGNRLLASEYPELNRAGSLV